MFEYLVSIATIATFFANFPQIYQIIKTKSAKDLSVLTFLIWGIITFILSIHAIRIDDIYFIISNIGMFIINSIILVLIFKYR